MKNTYLLLLFLSAYTVTSYAQTLTNRTDDTTTPLDERLAIGKTLSIPFGPAPSLNGGLARLGSLFFSTTDSLLYVYKGSDGWQVAGPKVPSYIFGTGLKNTSSTITNDLITGNASGQTITGGQDASGYLTLRSTSNATKGKIYFGNSAFDESTNRLGINLNNPNEALSVNGNAWITGVIYATSVGNPTATEYSKVELGSSGVRAVRNIGDNNPALQAIQMHEGSTGNIFQWRNVNGIQGVISQTGKMGIGVTSPSAYLHLKAGNSAANSAPIKFTPGTNLSTPESNAMEWDGSRLYQTNNTGTRNSIAYLSDINSANLTGTGTNGSLIKWIGNNTIGDAIAGTDYLTPSEAVASFLPLNGGAISGSLSATSFIKPSGTSSQFLKADGSVDGTTYQTVLGFTAANNANVVHLSGDESIAGTKSFTDKVAIGAINPGSYQLAVKGTIRTQAIKVDPNGWADDVFAKSYKLPALSDVEKFIIENQHLPDIPSEAEVKKNGIELGEMNALLLKKIEELTLYMIEKDKQLEKANQKIGDLAKKVDLLIAR